MTLMPTHSDYSLRNITAIVIGLHCLMIVFSFFINESPTKKIISPPRLVVQTIALSPSVAVRTTKQNQEIAHPLPVVSSPTVEKEIVESEPEQKQTINEREDEVAPKAKIDPSPVKKEKKPIPPPPQKTKPAVVPKLKEKTPPPKETTPKPVEKAKKTPPPKPIVKKVEAAKPFKDELKDKAAAEKKAAEKQKQVIAAEKAAAEAQKKKEAEIQEQKVKQQKLLAQAQEKIAKISRGRDKTISEKSPSLSNLPTSITTLQIEAESGSSGPSFTEKEISYRDELATRLKLQLRLPEYGEVKIKLTLDRSGKVTSVVVVNAESVANKKHIEKLLPTMSFPAFGKSFGEAKNYTFSITLSNEL